MLLVIRILKVLKAYMEKAKAFIFAAEEDFGIIVVEAMACGTPVIAFGNLAEQLNLLWTEKQGVLFPEQSTNSIIECCKKIRKNQCIFELL